MSENLIKALLDTGMFEMGLFQHNGTTTPFRFRLEMLPSYPDVLAEITVALLSDIRTLKIDRLVCPIEALPIGTAVSLKSGIPLVYSRGRGESPVYDLVGAYDVGHPACLLLNVLDDAETVFDFVRRARSVGLNIGQVVTVVDFETIYLPELDCHSLLTLTGIAEMLSTANLITPLLAQSILGWQKQQGRMHPAPATSNLSSD